MTTYSNDSDENAFESIEVPIPRPVRFWIFLLADVPSVVCSFVLLIYFWKNHSTRRTLNNHVVFLILICGLGVELVDVPFHLAYIIDSGIVKPSTPATCLIWWFITYGLFNGQQILLAWAAIERHILIFNAQLMTTKRARYCAHYLPLMVTFLYILSFYIYAIFIFPCENTFDYNLPACNASPCYQNDSLMGMWDFIGNNIVPGLLITFVSIALLIRVVRQKQRLKQQIHWRKHRKMTVQLLLMAILSMIFILPLNLLSLAHLCGLPEEIGADEEQYLFYTAYLFIFFIPFVVLYSTSKLWATIKMKLLCRLHHRIGVHTINHATVNTTRR
ncbi:unnamed protein product [Adineta ricciae]|uniref:G-protein coupled receptors family 1 profile domain-containing protein n=1 Tax=Adineta ricciae TaxID=249248 RepID=A0A815RF28_ADIRI|nr:unnamed protein product [Adineta ricciae]CAF1478288.1 unnamed protein product [Adineta ricciae]